MGPRVTLGASDRERQSPGRAPIVLGTNGPRCGSRCHLAAGLKAMTERDRFVEMHAAQLCAEPRGQLRRPPTSST